MAAIDTQKHIIKNIAIPETVVERIKKRALKNNRSFVKEAVTILEQTVHGIDPR